MDQETKSAQSRRVILDSALDLFSHQGYRATSVRDIATRAELSTGNVYHHFPDKESILRALLDEYWEILSDPELPFNKALAGPFPDNLEAMGSAAEKLVRKYRRYVALIYVDVVEFNGTHIRKFYSTMAKRFKRLIDERGDAEIRARLRPGVDPVSAMMLATRFYFNYFSVEVLFGVKNHFGKDSKQVTAEITDILRRGMQKE